MEKHYLFKTGANFDRVAFEDSMASIGVEGIEYWAEDSGEFLADSSLIAELEPLLTVVRDDLGSPISFLVSHEHSPFEEKLLKEAFAYFPNQAMFPTDVLMKEMSFGDYSSYKSLKNRYDKVPGELLLTAGTYLRCGMDASLCAKRLFIHRNTFLYRMNQFIELTNLDIRDYHNALLLELYFQMAGSYMTGGRGD